MPQQVKRTRRRGFTRLSPKHQATIPNDVVTAAGLRVGDELRVEVEAPGRVVLVRVEDPIVQFAGALTGTYGPDYVERLRSEWD
jgi:bifunctional DNA-binding transcriptional regulator/antitoxin component of YhaV-PrlF toxin-antitoxin module